MGPIQLVTGSSDSIRIWDSKVGNSVKVIPVNTPIFSLCELRQFPPLTQMKEKSLAFASGDSKYIKIWVVPFFGKEEKKAKLVKKKKRKKIPNLEKGQMKEIKKKIKQK